MQQPLGEDIHLLSPEKMSLTNCALYAYKAGFRKPTLEEPCAARAELTRDTMPANTWLEAEVPETAVREEWKIKGGAQLQCKNIT